MEPGDKLQNSITETEEDGEVRTKEAPSLGQVSRKHKGNFKIEKH